MKNIDKLKRTLNDMAKANIKLSLVRAKVKAVDWDAKTMIVESLVDGLEYFDVLLGFGAFYQQPTVGTTCLIGIYDGHKTAGFLVDVDKVEEAIYTSGLTTLTIKENGFVIKQDQENLKLVLNDWQDKIGELIDQIVIIANAAGAAQTVAPMLAIKETLTDDNIAGTIKNRLNIILTE